MVHRSAIIFMSILAVTFLIGGCKSIEKEEASGFESAGSSEPTSGKGFLGDCESLTQTDLENGSYADETAEAILLIEDANRNLCSIRVLYTQNNSKVNELQDALKKDDVATVKSLSDELSLAINDGYVFAESAKESINMAQTLDIDPNWQEYLRLKETSIDLQLKAFKFRKDSAQLFRDKFGGDDKLSLMQAKQTFKSNEENFNKLIKEAEGVNNKADEVAKNSEQ